MIHNSRTSPVVVLALIAAAHLSTNHGLARAQDRPSSGATKRAPLRTASGQPDLEGTWRTPPGTVYTYDLEAPAPPDVDPGVRLNFRPIIVDPPDGRIPYQPWARRTREQLQKASSNPKSLAELDPQIRCVPGAPPRTSYQGPFQIIQPPGYVVFLTENVHQFRVVPLDGRPHLTNRVKLFTGDSRGHWEGDTLVVDVTNNNGGNWLDIVGDFRTDASHVVERWTRVGPEALRYEATIEDPNLYTRPWTMTLTHRLGRNGNDPYDLLEQACHEGNRTLRRLLAAPHEK